MTSNIFRDMIFPHINTKKQRKEINYIYCLNVRIADYRHLNDMEFNQYVNSILHFSHLNSQNNLVTNELVDAPFRNRMIDVFTRTQDGNSALVDVRYISPKEKKDMDDFLLFSGWNKKIDKYGYVFEGCQNDNKLFLGGKKDMMVFYCQRFSNTKLCQSLMNKTKLNYADKGINKIFSDPEKSEKFVNNLMNYIDKTFAEGMERVEDINVDKMSKENKSKI